MKSKKGGFYDFNATVVIDLQQVLKVINRANLHLNIKTCPLNVAHHSEKRPKRGNFW